MSKTVAESAPRRLNLGCGEDIRAGWHNVDVDPGVGADQQMDLGTVPWDLPSDHFTVVEARHVLEHLETVPWGELCRILEPNARVVWVYPIGHTRFEDAQHKQYWNYHTAEQITGTRAHGHELDLPLELLDRDVSWWISGHEPLAELYTRYRLWARGPGPWLSQVPGLCGEVEAVYRYGGGR